MENLRSTEYFAQRAVTEMNQKLATKKRSLLEALTYSCRIVGLHEEDAGLAGQISARSETRLDTYWTLRWGLGFEEATEDDFVEVDKDLNVITGTGMPNPATRFHLWVYAARPDVNSIIHTHSPYVSVLAAAGQPLIISQMDMTPLYNDCAFLGAWPGLPIADQEGVIISEALGDKKAIILVNHGQLTAGVSIQEAAVLSVVLERSARTQVRASVYGLPKPVDPELAKVAHDYILREKHVNATFDYWARQTDRKWGLPPQKKVEEPEAKSNVVNGFHNTD
ncbi:class II aldolase/adducin family protein [Xylariales sp. PMI_506]|nr:class II aldolase/adducin family protein [Xylariales sp. PMI_506]